MNRRSPGIENGQYILGRLATRQDRNEQRMLRPLRIFEKEI